MKFVQIAIIASLPLFIGCNAPKESAQSETVQSEELEGSITIDPNYMDKTIRPQDDFYQFSNGTWVKGNPVPDNEVTWGSFNELINTNNKKITKLLNQAATTQAEKGTDEQLLGAYFSSFTDMKLRNEKSIDPLLAELEKVNALYSKDDLVKTISLMHKDGIGALFSFWVGVDIKDVDKHIVQVGQGGLGLPNRDYYFDEDKKEILELYKEHIALCYRKIRMDDVEKALAFANQVVNFESKLAEASMTRVELRDPEKTYNKVPLKKAKTMFGKFDFEGYLKVTGIEAFDDLIVRQPKFIYAIAKMLNDVELEDWKAYLKWKVINEYAGHLSEGMVKINFDFYGKTLSGRKEMKPIEERAIHEITGQVFSEVLGKAFVAKHYSSEAKDRVNDMVDNLLVVFEERIKNLDWMSSTTKAEALKKLKAIGRKLGYPEEWEDFSSLDFKPDDYIHNLKQCSAFSFKKNIEKLDKPVDKKEWGMPAHMVNAYYSPSKNEIAFPAGIMQPPFFSEDYEDAVNYSRIGMVIGHEFTHGFDDNGSKFSADGNFKNWWTEDDRTLFEERTEKLGNTFSSFCPIDGHCVNPKLTMGENIADLGGLTMAYYAYTMTDEFKSGATKKGYTPAQRFFIGYAQLWKINYTDEALKHRIENDPHSPGMYRVNGPLMNCPEFFEAFNVQEGDPMRNSPDKISKIW